ncbi:hypothetical protein KAJ27_16360 [bacterium]|nr:hypothetical protein [bacterium]
MKKYALILCLVFGFCFILNANTTISENFLGTYKFIGDAEEKKELNNALNRFIHQIPFFVRPFYRSQIKSGFTIPKEIKIISNKKGWFSIDASLEKPVFTDLKKTLVTYKKPDGKKTKVQRSLTGSKILEKFTDGRGVRLNSYKLSSDGHKLIYTVKFTSARLRKPLWFRLSFVKKD